MLRGGSKAMHIPGLNDLVLTDSTRRLTRHTFMDLTMDRLVPCCSWILNLEVPKAFRNGERRFIARESFVPISELRVRGGDVVPSYIQLDVLCWIADGWTALLKYSIASG